MSTSYSTVYMAQETMKPGSVEVFAGRIRQATTWLQEERYRASIHRNIRIAAVMAARESLIEISKRLGRTDTSDGALMRKDESQMTKSQRIQLHQEATDYLKSLGGTHADFLGIIKATAGLCDRFMSADERSQIKVIRDEERHCAQTPGEYFEDLLLNYRPGNKEFLRDLSNDYFARYKTCLAPTMDTMDVHYQAEWTKNQLESTTNHGDEMSAAFTAAQIKLIQNYMNSTNEFRYPAQYHSNLLSERKKSLFITKDEREEMISADDEFLTSLGGIHTNFPSIIHNTAQLLDNRLSEEQISQLQQLEGNQPYFTLTAGQHLKDWSHSNGQEGLEAISNTFESDRQHQLVAIREERERERQRQRQQEEMERVRAMERPVGDRARRRAAGRGDHSCGTSLLPFRYI